jgi:hypothetical protein
VPDGIYPAMHAMQPPGGHPMRHGPAPQPDRFELAPRNDAVLALRQLRDRAIRRVLDEFCTYVVHFSSLAEHGLSVAGKCARVTRRL